MNDISSKRVSRGLLFAIAVFVIILLIGLYLRMTGHVYQESINSFEECIEAGYPIIDSYPEQCEAPDGEIFVREVDDNDLPLDVAIHIESKKDIISLDSPRPFTGISSPLVVTGEARGSWYFEADFPIRLEDEDGNSVAVSHGTAQLDPDDPNSTWMTEDFVPFEGVLEFEVPSTETGVLILKKDNPSGLPENDDELRIPIRFEQNRTRIINLYYYDSERDWDEDSDVFCTDAGLVAVQREVPVTRTPVQDAVNLLLEGSILPEEVNSGITTGFPLEGVELKGASTKDGVLTLEFSDPFYMTSGGSCRSRILWLQIRDTANQFEGINKVQFQPEELFQP